MTSDFPSAALLPADDSGWWDDAPSLDLTPIGAGPAAAIAPGLPQAPKPDGGLAAWQVRRIRSMIEARLSQRLPIADLAAAARLSSSHFARAFKRSFGCSPHHYLLWRRIEHAKDRMQSSDDSLAQIALTHGFADQAHFTRCFKRLQGETPGGWYRRIAGETARLAAPTRPA